MGVRECVVNEDDIFLGMLVSVMSQAIMMMSFSESVLDPKLIKRKFSLLPTLFYPSH